MEKNQKVIDLYLPVLKLAGLESNEQGMIGFSMFDNFVPMTISKRSVFLPTHQNIRTLDAKESLFFHPLNENVSIGESEVMQRLRRVMAKRIESLSMRLLLVATTIHLHPETQQDLDPDNMEFLKTLTSADEKFLGIVRELLEQVVADRLPKDLSMCSLYIRNKGTVEDVRFNRVCVVTMPFYDALFKDAEIKIGEFKLRKKDIAIFKEWFKLLFPTLINSTNYTGENRAELYNYGSNSLIAPSMDSLIHVMINLFDNYNTVARDVPSAETFDLAWSDVFVDIDALQTVIRSVNVAAQPTTTQSTITTKAANKPIPMGAFNEWVQARQDSEKSGRGYSDRRRDDRSGPTSVSDWLRESSGRENNRRESRGSFGDDYDRRADTRVYRRDTYGEYIEVPTRRH